ncbi:glycine-N-acyltransferase-like protein 3 isoform X1 [Triplophysa rosa]|uniref:Glycine N-acyltransferase-like protein n=1 Tax=Triplophysa rosa TaxID=992332 RepID=A0A9W8C1T5_TRIRA|nr:glycine-N-acyltransferase-like protein 3 isoform X1 [Triplophysa rosa]XP_057197950.1 glycine-N-acyltransferase-like protein 3 isoform X1 [Triplophysa rosa]KAI7805825.1 putative glycine N-acyltransferase-like protein 3 [Triplophysa rosa]
MRILNSDELKHAEITLYAHLPKSLKVYGFVFALNRGKPHTLEVVVDSWPVFTTIIVRPDPNNGRAKDFMKKVTLYTTNEEVLKRMLTVENAIDWSTYFLVGGITFLYLTKVTLHINFTFGHFKFILGCDVRHAPMLKEIAASRDVLMKGYTLVHLMTLPEPNHVPELSDLELKVSVLNESHADVVNKTWKFGGDEKGYQNILNLITHFPTCCITDENNQPVSWVLLYNYCALGILYTQPEHRGKGYAKALVTIMAKKLYSQGYPVYCFIEECNQLSYKLFESLGFTEDPSYRAAWYEFITPV